MKSLLLGTEVLEVRAPSRNTALRVWRDNNFLHILVMAFVAGLWHYLWVTNPQCSERRVFLILLVVTCVSNSAFDLYKMRDFYIPKLDEIYKQAQEESKRIATQAREPHVPSGNT